MKGDRNLWLGTAAAVFGACVVAALTLRESHGLAVFCDLAESTLLISGSASLILLAVRARGRMRLFWSLISFGITLWLSYQLLWTYYEVVLRKDVPDIFAGDVILFLNIVPLMAALALRPHAPRDEYSARLGRLDFALLLIWWLYLYVLLVIPWQYVVPNVFAYNRNLNSIYTLEKIAFLAGLGACYLRSKGGWRKLYGSIFAMSFCYAAGSALANWAIGHKLYYTGSLYDIPLALAMAWLTWIGLCTEKVEPHPDAREVSTVYGVWVARCGMIAVFSLPLFAAWSLLDQSVPGYIRAFRLSVTLLAALGMGTLVFWRQALLDRELIRLLHHSHESVANLQRLQSQIIQSEKMASIGQLVGGAAHEMNNPITAMLGYSDLLLSTKLNPEQQWLAARIGQQVRRTKSLVASLISFAKQGTAAKSALDLNTLARTAVKLLEPQCAGLNVLLHTEFDPTLPKVIGDSNQLLQVCLQLIGNCLHVISEHSGNTLSLRTRFENGAAALELATECTRPGATSVEAGHDSASVQADDNLAFSACRGILQEHRGVLRRETRDGFTVLRVELPAMQPVSASAAAATSQALWQSQPSV